jgi:hypothetical protein
MAGCQNEINNFVLKADCLNNYYVFNLNINSKTFFLIENKWQKYFKYFKNIFRTTAPLLIIF